MLRNTHGIRLHVLGQICLLYLPQHAFVECTVGFCLTRQFLIADSRLVQGQGGFLLRVGSCLQAFFGVGGLFNGITQQGRLCLDRLTKALLRLLHRRASRNHFGMFVFVALRKCGNRPFHLRNIPTAFVNHGRCSNTWYSQQLIQIVASFFDLV